MTNARKLLVKAAAAYKANDFKTSGKLFAQAMAQPDAEKLVQILERLDSVSLESTSSITGFMMNPFGMDTHLPWGDNRVQQREQLARQYPDYHIIPKTPENQDIGLLVDGYNNSGINGNNAVGKEDASTDGEHDPHEDFEEEDEDDEDAEDQDEEDDDNEEEEDMFDDPNHFPSSVSNATDVYGELDETEDEQIEDQEAEREAKADEEVEHKLPAVEDSEKFAPGVKTEAPVRPASVSGSRKVQKIKIKV